MDVTTIDYQCPGTFRMVSQKLQCKPSRKWSQIIPNVPIPEWVPTSPYELARTVTIMRQTYIPERLKKDVLLDEAYETLLATGLAVAYAYFRDTCLHISGHVRQAQCTR